MLADLRKVGSDHGMKPEEVEGAIEFPQTQPGGQ
jgi:hypothetical protein